MKYVECGSCGCYHKEEYCGDCRNDDERYNLDELEFFSATNDIEVIHLEDQMEN